MSEKRPGSRTESSSPDKKAKKKGEDHQFQAGQSTDRDIDQWKHRAPYRVHEAVDDNFAVQWTGHCHCGRVAYQLGRERPLASKYCHCTTCQRLHGAPFQWAAIFHKADIHFTRGHHDLGWYDPSARSTTHHLPCKVQCAYCRTPVMDEGRNMILLFPTLLDGINTPRGRDAFQVQHHMFYPQRVVDIKGDGVPKWAGLSESSKRVDDDGRELPGQEGEGEGEGEREKGDEES